nr:protein MAIN-LIKE 1-like [Solanum lycopersicum]
MAANNAYQLDPGPLDPSVLNGKLTHRSRDIWIGNDDMILNTRKYDGKFWDLVNEHPIHPRVLDVIKLSGIYSVYRTGESTITLPDVEILYGLPVKGNAVVGYEPQRSVVDWKNICQRLLGFSPQPQDFKHSSLKVSALNAHLRLQPRLPDLATQDMVNEKARCYMFWMIVGLLLADTSGGLLKLMYLPMLEDITTVGSYSWGSATLAYLYRFLCKASQSSQNEIAGFLPLLQFIWEPYSSDIIESLPEYCRVGRDIWRARVPIFCWDVVEVHLPDRVMRRITRFVIGNPISSPQQQQGYVPNATTYETMVRHIHLMVNKAISLSENPSMEEFYGFCAMVRDEGSNCLAYVQEADRTQFKQIIEERI